MNMKKCWVPFIICVFYVLLFEKVHADIVLSFPTAGATFMNQGLGAGNESNTVNGHFFKAGDYVEEMMVAVPSITIVGVSLDLTIDRNVLAPPDYDDDSYFVTLEFQFGTNVLSQFNIYPTYGTGVRNFAETFINPITIQGGNTLVRLQELNAVEPGQGSISLDYGLDNLTLIEAIPEPGLIGLLISTMPVFVLIRGRYFKKSNVSSVYL